MRFPGVAVIRDGIIVEWMRASLGSLESTGWLYMDTVRLNASRSKVVRDERFLKVWRPVVAQMIDLVFDHLHGHLPVSRGRRISEERLGSHDNGLRFFIQVIQPVEYLGARRRYGVP